jgi:hypothetical protein
MTINETEEIEASCRRDAKVNPNGPLLFKAAEAIRYLLEQLAEAEGCAEWIKVKDKG